MSTLVKALLATMAIIVALIGLPILVGLLGILWPLILIIFVLVAIGIIIGKASGNKKED